MVATGNGGAPIRERISTSRRRSRVSSTRGDRMSTSSCPSFRTSWGVCRGECRDAVCLSGGRPGSRLSSSWKTGGMVLGQKTALAHWWRRRRGLSADGMLQGGCFATRPPTQGEQGAGTHIVSRTNTGWSSLWITPLVGRQRWLSWQGTGCRK